MLMSIWECSHQLSTCPARQLCARMAQRSHRGISLLLEFLTLKFVSREIPSGAICILVPKLPHNAYIRSGVLTTFTEMNPLF